MNAKVQYGAHEYSWRQGSLWRRPLGGLVHAWKPANLTSFAEYSTVIRLLDDERRRNNIERYGYNGENAYERSQW